MQQHIMIHYTQCPVCGNNDIQPLFTAKDFTVSGQSFPICRCSHCQALFTQDVPDELSIGPFYKSDNYVSHSDTRKGLVNRLYHTVRSVTLQSKYKTVCHETSRAVGSVLDIGCGTGAFLDTMLKKGWEVRGLEPDEAARNKSTELYGIAPLPSGELFHLAPGSFHAITMWHVLEHVHELHAYLKQIRNLLQDDGRLLIAVPNHSSTDAGLYQSYWAAYDVPRHLYHFSPDCMRSLMKLHDMEVVAIRPMWFDAFYVCLLSEQYKNGKGKIFRPVRAFFNGLISNIAALGNREKCSSLIYVIRKLPA